MCNQFPNLNQIKSYTALLFPRTCLFILPACYRIISLCHLFDCLGGDGGNWAIFVANAAYLLSVLHAFACFCMTMHDYEILCIPYVLEKDYARLFITMHGHAELCMPMYGYA